MQSSGFFNAIVEQDGTYDREYDAIDFARYFASFVGNGIFIKSLNKLQVIEETPQSMNVIVRSGQAFIDGYWFENTEDYVIQLQPADGILNRIDSIVLRKGVLERSIEIALKTGTPANTPIAPSVLRTADYYELKLADIKMNAGSTKIKQDMIYDTRLDSNVCGIVSGLFDQIDTTDVANQLQSYMNDFKADTTQEATDLLASLHETITADPLGDLIMRMNKIESVTSFIITPSMFDTTVFPYKAVTHNVRITASSTGILVSDIAKTATLEAQKAYMKAFSIYSQGAIETYDGYMEIYVWKLPAVSVKIAVKGV